MKTKINILLNRSFHEKLGAEEQQKLDEALRKDPVLQKEAAKLKKLYQIMGEQEYHFGYYFAENVMSRLSIARENGSREISMAFQRIALPGLVVAIIIFLIAILGGSLSFNSLMGLDNMQPEYLSDFFLYNY